MASIVEASHQNLQGGDSGSAYSTSFQAGSVRSNVSPLAAFSQFSILKTAAAITVIALAAYLGYRLLRSRK